MYDVWLYAWVGWITNLINNLVNFTKQSHHQQALTPRMLSTIAAAASQRKPTQKSIVNCAGVTTARSIDAPFLYSTSEELRAKEQRAAGYVVFFPVAMFDK